MPPLLVAWGECETVSAPGTVDGATGPPSPRAAHTSCGVGRLRIARSASRPARNVDAGQDRLGCTPPTRRDRGSGRQDICVLSRTTHRQVRGHARVLRLSPTRIAPPPRARCASRPRAALCAAPQRRSPARQPPFDVDRFIRRRALESEVALSIDDTFQQLAEASRPPDRAAPPRCRRDRRRRSPRVAAAPLRAARWPRGRCMPGWRGRRCAS